MGQMQSRSFNWPACCSSLTSSASGASLANPPLWDLSSQKEFAVVFHRGDLNVQKGPLDPSFHFSHNGSLITKAQKGQLEA